MKRYSRKAERVLVFLFLLFLPTQLGETFLAGMESGDGSASGLLIPHCLSFGCVVVFVFCHR